MHVYKIREDARVHKNGERSFAVGAPGRLCVCGSQCACVSHLGEHVHVLELTAVFGVMLRGSEGRMYSG